MAYEVRLDVFQGPFDLLLQLITARDIDLYEVRLTDIVDGFLAELAALGDGLDLEVATEFVLIAATLVELKCRWLLPGSGDVDLDDELALFEARDYLLARLVECKTYSGAAHRFAELEVAAARSIARRSGPDERFAGLTPDLLAHVSLEALWRAASDALATRPIPRVSTGHLHGDEVTVAEVVDELSERLAPGVAMSFRALTVERSTAYVVACFLALLELYKQGFLELDQGETFGELVVTWAGEPADRPSAARASEALA